MKKTYVYFLAPLVGLLIFGVLYWNFSSKYEQNQKDIATRAVQAKKDKLDKENADRLKAFNEAVAASDRAKQAKEEKEKKDAADADARQQASDVRYNTKTEASNLAKKIEGLNKDIEATKKEIADIEGNKKKAGDEQAFLADYVKLAQTNVNGLQGVLQKIKDADDAAAAAAKAAADAAAAAAKAKK